jgi:hypothetical protein
MRSIYGAIKVTMLGGMVLVLSAAPALAFGENKVLDEKPKVEINKVEIKKAEINKAEKAMLQEKKVEEPVAVKMKSILGLGELLEEGLLGEGILGLEE